MINVVPKYIADLISSGESQVLDFKFEISDVRKIAKTLVAFANTDGGKLLIGVKDNGKIAGIRTDEEVFMIESAAKIFSKPKISFQIKSWKIAKKQILEVSINKGSKKPYFAKDYDNKWKAYRRVADQNFLANTILVKYWKEKDKRAVNIHFSRKEQLLLDYIKDYGSITLSDFIKYAQISKKYAQNILVNFLILDIIEMHITEKEVFFSFKDEK